MCLEQRRWQAGKVLFLETSVKKRKYVIAFNSFTKLFFENRPGRIINCRRERQNRMKYYDVNSKKVFPSISEVSFAINNSKKNWTDWLPKLKRDKDRFKTNSIIQNNKTIFLI